MDALLAACRQRLDSPGLLERESVAARQRALRLFAIKDVADRLERAYLRAGALAAQRHRLA
jgi:hypothetical protein